MTKERSLSRVAVALCALGAGACSSGEPGATATAELGRARQSIIGGFLAPSPALDHVGSLVAIDRTSGAVNSFCTAVLIGEETAVTARHCIRNVPALDARGSDVFFGMGPDGLAPDRLIELAALAEAPGDEGGFLEIGSDVAVVHLDAPAGVRAAVPRPLDVSFEGRSMVTLGYGVFGASGTSDDRRRIGRVTVAATSGNPLELMLGSFEGFVEWRLTQRITDADFLAEHAGDAAVEARLPALRAEFELSLLPEHEVLTGLAPGDTQVCRGDSGGPLALVAADGTWEVYGVASATLDSERLSCDFGTIFATFGPLTLPFLEQARGWTDPCGELGAAALCEAGVARRCETDLSSGVRRVVEGPCASLEPDAGAASR